MKTALLRVLMFGAMTSCLGFFSGCQTTDPTAQATPVVEKDEYVRLEPELGSRIRKRVKKSEIAKEAAARRSKEQKVTEETVLGKEGVYTTGEMEKIVAPSN